MNNSVNVYFDESGYTGENLLSDNQPTFSYATVKITNTEAVELVNKILSKYPKQTQSGELKATTLLKSEKGIELISEVLIQIQNNIKISVSDKKYALAAKFFEYMIEKSIEGTNILDEVEDYLIYIDSLLDTNPFIETI